MAYTHTKIISAFIRDNDRSVRLVSRIFSVQATAYRNYGAFYHPIRERRVKSATRREAECKRGSPEDWRDRKWGLRCIVRRPVEHLNGFSSSSQDCTRESWRPRRSRGKATDIVWSAGEFRAREQAKVARGWRRGEEGGWDTPVTHGDVAS